MRINDLIFDERRFWANVNIADGCWTWKRSTTGSLGYGQVKVRRRSANGRKPATVLAHRMMYLIVYGEIPNRKQVLHKCDNPRCVNPAHLWLGTQLDNIHDCRKKGRSRNGNIKLTVAQIEAIRNEPTPHHYTRLAAKYGIERTQIRRIIKGECWHDLNRHPEKWGRPNDRRPQIANG